MLKFKTKEELQNCEELQKMGRYSYQKVELDGKEVFACTTNQQYEDIIWGGIYTMLKEVCLYYDKEDEDKICDISSEIRDMVLDKLDKDMGITFVDVYDEY